MKNAEIKRKIPYAGRVYDQREKDLLHEAAEEFMLTAGRFADRFARGLGDFLGVNHVSLCNSGSSANLLAFMALTQPELGERRIMPGDEVITTALCFPTTVAPIVQYGAVPVFVDITIPEYNVDCSQLEAALSPKTKAVVLAHTLGNPFDISKVIDFCLRHNLWLIEDNCDALGSEYHVPLTPAPLPQGGRGKEEGASFRRTGTFGHLSTLSFYPAHHITTGEGGAVCTNNAQLARIVNSLRDWGRHCDCAPGQDNACGARFSRQCGALPEGYDHKYVYIRFGYNLKMTDLQAAIGCAQMEKLEGFIEKRQANWCSLKNGLQNIPGLILPHPTGWNDPSWFAFMLTVKEDAGFTRNEIVQYLEEQGIQTRMPFAGNITAQPCFNHQDMPDCRMVGYLPNTDLVMRDSFMVGVYPGLSEEDMGYIGEQITAFTEAHAYAA